MENRSLELMKKADTYSKELKLKRVFVGGYKKQMVDTSIEELTSLYREVMEEKDLEGERALKRVEEDLDKALQKIESLEQQKEELHHQYKRAEEKYESEMVKIAGMKEQLAEAMVQTNQEKVRTIKAAKDEAKEILENAHEQAAQIMDDRLVELNRLVEEKCKELEELEAGRAQGVVAVDDIQAQLNQLTFKLSHIKRMLQKPTPSASQIFKDKEEQVVS
ncbi:MAG TPA: hypothetical protein VIR32_05555 [Lachnospiraceae bacterium]